MTLSSRRPALAVWLLVTAVSILAFTTTASATTPGPQYQPIGQYGQTFRGGGFDSTAYDGGLYDHALTPGLFLDPTGFAVDTQDTTAGGDGTALYVLDRTSPLPHNATGGVTTWRLQKLDDHGNVLGTDQFSLPVTNQNFEMSGLAVDPSGGAVYALMVSYNNQQGAEQAYEILGWSTTPNGSSQLVPATGLTADAKAIGINAYPTPGRLSTVAQLTGTNGPYAISPEGLALDVTGGHDYLAIATGQDYTGNASAGIIQVCASCTGAQQGAVSTSNEWSSQVLTGLPNDPGPGSEATYQAAGISTAPDGSLTLLLDEGSGNAAQDQDIVSVPADLTSPPTILASQDNAPLKSDGATSAVDDAAIFDRNVPLFEYGGDDTGTVPAAHLASPQVVALSNGLYAGEFEPAPFGAADPESLGGTQGMWTQTTPGVRLLCASGAVTGNPCASLPPGNLANPSDPLTSLFDTLGNPSPSGACALTDSTTIANSSAANPSSSYPSLAAGANGAIWVLTRGSDSNATYLGSNKTGGRQLIELSPGASSACPGASGTFSLADNGGALQSATTPLTVTAGDTVNFDASSIAYPGGSQPAAKAEYNWDFGDGTPASPVLGDPTAGTWAPPTTSHVYTQLGTHTVTMTLYGDFGAYVESGTVNVVANTPPTAAFSYQPSSPATGATVSFDASGSTASQGLTITNYHWNWGDGSNPDDTSSPTDSHAYASAGTHTVTLTVTDSHHSQSQPVTHAVTVSAAPTTTTSSTTTTTTTTTTTSSTTTTPPLPPPPAVKAGLVSTTVKNGQLPLTVSCPSGQTTCTGTVLIKTASAVAASSKKHKKTVLKLGAASFGLAGGHRQTLSVRIAGKGLTYLRKHHSVSVFVVISARNPQGETYSKSTRTTLHYAKPKRRKHGRRLGTRHPYRALGTATNVLAIRPSLVRLRF